MGTGKTEEYVGNTIQQHTAVLISEDGVLEGRLLLVAYNLLDVGTLILDGCFESRKIITLLNLAEIWSSEWETALLQEWILTTAARILGER